MMKKRISFFMCFVFLLIGWSSLALSAPITGTWNADTTGLGEDWLGVFVSFDPDGDGPTIGDLSFGQDTYLDTPGLPYFWGLSGSAVESFSIGDFINNQDGTATQTITTHRTGGTFYIFGDHLWGQDPGTVYSISVETDAWATVVYNWQDDQWVYSYLIGGQTFYGMFADLSYTFNAHSEGYLLRQYYDEQGALVSVYPSTDFQIEIAAAPVPEPGTMLLLGTGLIGLIGAGRKKIFKK